MCDRHRVTEEPCEGKLSSTVLESGGSREGVADFNSRCRHVHPEKGKSYRNGKKFKCGHCGFEHDADINAAINIADLGGAVSLPGSPGIACLLEGQLPLFRLA